MLLPTILHVAAKFESLPKAIHSLKWDSFVLIVGEKEI